MNGYIRGYVENTFMRRDAFTLVELSIVLVILGLLVGGVLTGQSLIRAAELRAVTREEMNYATAAQTFRDKYFAIPGDMPNATSFWGSSTVNGNGDGVISASSAGASAEIFQFWNQLALAGLIEGSYTGITGSGGPYHTIIGTNVPKSHMSNGGWFAYTQSGSYYAGDGNLYAADYGSYLEFGANYPNSNPNNPLLKPEEAWNIDTKIDDGKPGTGKVIAIYWNNACGTGGSGPSDTASVYNLSNTSAQCALYFTHQF